MKRTAHRCITVALILCLLLLSGARVGMPILIVVASAVAGEIVGTHLATAIMSMIGVTLYWMWQGVLTFRDSPTNRELWKHYHPPHGESAD